MAYLKQQKCYQRTRNGAKLYRVNKAEHFRRLHRKLNSKKHGHDACKIDY